MEKGEEKIVNEIVLDWSQVVAPIVTEAKEKSQEIFCGIPMN